MIAVMPLDRTRRAACDRDDWIFLAPHEQRRTPDAIV
jgi:hypothetical protein